MKKGYSLVELMVTVSIVGIVVSFGVSAYGRGRDRQEGRAAGEQIIGFLSENQKKANIGDKDCVGLYLGQDISLSGTTFTAKSKCNDASTIKFGALNTISINGITSMDMNTASILFNPLSQGTTIDSDPVNINYISNSGTPYKIEVSRAGTIEYKGVQ